MFIIKETKAIKSTSAGPIWKTATCRPRPDLQ